ncbi:hypothetical protein DPMN_187528 [Dreissena polymorpha]|uniref:Uncharacterized protein n=1 Tax=Dreissena polymorpha TaxID=45954 RepID=A0A9D4DRR8_DREPO|nr:hypothetical protein DPMN_187528 [Dreissena polymorpha]
MFSGKAGNIYVETLTYTPDTPTPFWKICLNGLELCENGVIVEAKCYELSSNFVDGLERG